MRLYHMSTKRDTLVKHFVPRVPYSCADDIGEDITIPRVCFADSPEHCLQAIGFSKELSNITLYEGEFDLCDPALYTPGYVQRYVKDAMADREYWYCKEITLTGKQYWVEHFEKEFSINWFVITKARVFELAELVMHECGVDNWILHAYTTVINSSDAESAYNNLLGAAKSLYGYDTFCALSDDVWDGLLEEDWAKLLEIKNLRLKPLM